MVLSFSGKIYIMVRWVLLYLFQLWNMMTNFVQKIVMNVSAEKHCLWRHFHTPEIEKFNNEFLIQAVFLI